MTMPGVRLTGLLLFITAILIGLAAATTQTSHLKFKRPDAVVAAAEGAATTENIQFVSVPILYPLVAVAMFGLLLWFTPAGFDASRSTSRKTKKRRTSSKRKSSNFFDFGARRSTRKR